MSRRPFRHPLLWSPILAAVCQLILAGTVAAVTGGGDFPMSR